MKKILIPGIVLVLVAIGVYFLMTSGVKAPTTPSETVGTTTPEQPAPVVEEEKPITSIGTSVGGRDILAYHFGASKNMPEVEEVVFVGGIHGGYEWNTSALAYELIKYLGANPGIIPANERVTIIPVVNPDGLAKVVSKSGSFTASDVDAKADTVAARFNANNVDLNRNFDCQWKSTGMWQNKSVSGGTSAMSEPESKAVQNYITRNSPSAVIVWFSAAGGVYASECGDGILPGTKKILSAYAEASGYPANNSYDYYETSGDLTNWLAKAGIPSISVLLTNHTDTEWTKNLNGVKAVLNRFANPN